MVINAFVLITVNFIVGTGSQSSFGTTGTTISNPMTEKSCLELKRNLEAISEQIKHQQQSTNYYEKRNTSLTRCVSVDFISLDIKK